MEEHRRHEFKLRYSVITVSSTRNETNDESGRLIMDIIRKNGLELTHYSIVKDDLQEIRKELFIASKKSDVIIFNGGTGISRMDVTPEALTPFLRQIPGFGEFFRMISYQEIGTAAMMSRALAGVFNGKIVFAIPGSPAACRLAMEKIILPEVNHIWYEITKE